MSGHEPSATSAAIPDAQPEKKNLYPDLEATFPNVLENGFKSFIRYVDTNVFDVPLDQAINVLTMASFYQIPALISKCVSLLKCSISERNVIDIYQVGIKLGEKGLSEVALRYIFRNAEKVVSSAAFLTVTENNLCAILERDELEIDELTLFNAVHLWGLQKCKSESKTPDNLWLVLQKPIKRIRFPLLKSEQLTTHVVPKQVLSDSELLELYKYSSLNSAQRASLVSSISFSTKRRDIRRKPTVYTINRFEGIQKEPWDCQSQFWRVDFKVNRSISIHGYGFLGSFTATAPNAVYDVEIQLIGPKMSVVRKEVVQTKKARETFSTQFIEPIRIGGGVWYTAVFKFNGPPTLRACGPCENVSIHCGDIGRVNFSFREAAENPAIHQLVQILFSF